MSQEGEAPQSGELPQQGEFQPFPKLPTELRFEIWKIAILDHSQDRLVPLIERTYSVIPTPYLACSPFLSVSRESRQVAIRLYPIRLSVTLDATTLSHGYTCLDIAASYRKPGAIYVSDKLDVFVLISRDLLYSKILYRMSNTYLDRVTIPKTSQRRSASLTSDQLANVRQLIVLEIVHLWKTKSRCTAMFHCMIIRDDMKHGNKYDKGLFKGVQRGLTWYSDDFQTYKACVNLLKEKAGIFHGSYTHHEEHVTFRDVPISRLWELSEPPESPCVL
ncbi:hypothetical protein NPX13_g1648 [Xylaria arbuscula]|uniref:2EXR domain-containing protein n=1 Tax=Xylaria arbuscula TaxID=114810 RepID=A0A9W8NLK4_9PEZI|nr:hypothetical protein NPX13_g1648 [Xylaria arbuscula]